MKTLILLAVIFVPIAYVIDTLRAPGTVRAQTVEQASANLSKTERDLRTTAASTGAQANAIKQGLASPDHSQLPSELQDFNRSTQRLVTLRADLGKDISTYQAACNEKLDTFDQERAAITDAQTQRSMNVLRRHTEQDMNERLAAARATLDHLDTVIAKGADLEHAAKCVLIAEELHTHGTDIDAQLKTAKEQAATYAKVTNGLLARINTALTE
jgi:hypothetical protein